MTKLLWSIAVALLVATSALGAQTGTVQRVTVHGTTLEHNLEGESADREVSIYLPPGYAAHPERRYPVLYFLHGLASTDTHWFGPDVASILGRPLPQTIDDAIAHGVQPMIVVTPNALTRFEGSMYSTSVTTGDWDAYIARELVAYVDAHYRTLARRESRGIAGHSMGGYGALRLAMRHPDVFSAVYALNPCCLAAVTGPDMKDLSISGARAADTVHTVEQAARAPFAGQLTLAIAAAWSPNPSKPPLFLDLPFENGAWHPDVAARWSANAILPTLDQHVFDLRRLRAIGMDAGTADGAAIEANTRALHAWLDANGIANTFEIYDGNHMNRVMDRMLTVVLPFFSAHLDAAR